MELNPILIDGFTMSVKMGRMTIEQVPIPYKEAVQQKLDDLKEEEITE